MRYQAGLNARNVAPNARFGYMVKTGWDGTSSFKSVLSGGAEAAESGVETLVVVGTLASVFLLDVPLLLLLRGAHCSPEAEVEAALGLLTGLKKLYI